jgi:hypothetical protein
LRSLGATIAMTNPISTMSKCSCEGRIVAWRFTKSQMGYQRIYSILSPSGNCWTPDRPPSRAGECAPRPGIQAYGFGVTPVSSALPWWARAGRLARRLCRGRGRRGGPRLRPLRHLRGHNVDVWSRPVEDHGEVWPELRPSPTVRCISHPLISLLAARCQLPEKHPFNG